jgi:Protein of unknown function (DUF998)
MPDGQRVPWWGRASSAAAPVVLIGGWTVAARLQPASYSQVTGTISALAAHGAADRWVMTLAFAAVAVCHVLTGLALRPAAWPGRAALIGAGLATAAVAASPLPGGGGGSVRHTAAAAISFITLAAWPALSVRRKPPPPDPGPAPPVSRPPPAVLPPAVLRPGVGAGASAVLFGLVVWFAVTLNTSGAPVGVAERLTAAAQALWPLAVAAACRHRPPAVSATAANPAP